MDSKGINNVNDLSAEKVIIEVMRYFGFRRNYQVAEYFEVTPQTLSGWIKSGEIPAKHLIKFKNEIEISKNLSTEKLNKFQNDLSDTEIKNYNYNQLSSIFLKNIKTIFVIPFLSVLFVSIYTLIFAPRVYTSESKVLPISEDGSASNSFSGFASQLGINIPLNMGGKVPWDEIYPEILKSSDLLTSMLEKVYKTEKYGDNSLKNILVREHKLFEFNELNQKNMVIDKLREMIKINKNRSSPIVNIHVQAFEPIFASMLAMDLILESSLIQRQLKTNRIKQKRLFIEERLSQVSLEMKKMEVVLREFRENNRNLSTSPSLQMQVEKMGREVDLQNSLYVTLKTQLEKAKIDEVGRDDMVQQIDGPSTPTRLTSPKIFINIAMSLFFGIFLSIFIIYVKNRNNKENIL